MRLIAVFLALLVMPSAASAGPVAAVFTAVGSIFTGSQIGALLLKTVLSVGLNLLAQKLRGKPKQPGMQTQARTSGGVEPQKIILGRAAVFGHLTYRNSTGKNRRDLVQVVELCDLPGVALEELLIDGEPGDLQAQTPEPLPTLLGLEIGARQQHAWVRFHDGSQTEADAQLVADFAADADRPWTNDHKLTGVAYAVVTTRYNRKVWKRGEPELRFVMRGIPLYDPRKDSSIGGSGAHRWDQPATWTYSANPIVIAYNIMRGIALPGGHVWGGQVAAEDLPLSSWVPAMNACDQPVQSSGGGTRPRYVAGMEVSQDREPADVIETFLQGADAQIAELGGVWTVQVGEPATAAAQISDDDLLVSEPEEFTPFKGLDAVHNAVSVKMTSPGALWQAHDLPLIKDAAAEAEDGERRTANISLPAVYVEAQAAQIGRANLADARRFRQHRFALPPDLFGLEPLDTIAWTSSWNSYSGKLFEIAEVAYDVERLVATVQVRERDPADFAWSADQELPAFQGAVTKIPHVDAGLPGFTVTPHTVVDANGLPARPAIKATWNASLIAASIAGLEIELRLKGAADINWRATLQEVEAGQLIIQQVLPATIYELRARPLSRTRQTSWLPWAEVTTPDVRLRKSDLAAEIAAELAAAQAAADAAAAEAQQALDESEAIQNQLGVSYYNKVQTDAAIVTARSDVDDFKGAFAGLTATTEGGRIAGIKATSWDNPDGTGGSVLELKGDVIAEGTVATNRLAVGLGQNLLSNTDFTDGLAGWILSSTGAQVAETSHSIRPPGVGFSGKYHPVMQIYQQGQGDGVADIRYRPRFVEGVWSFGVPVTPGDWIEASVRLSAHRATGLLWIQYTTADGQYLGLSPILGSRDAKGDHENPDLWPVIWGRHQVPAGAAYATIRIRKLATDAGEANSYLLIHKPQLATSHAHASMPAPYSPGGTTLIEGDQLATGSIIARHITAGELITNKAQIRNLILDETLIAPNAISRMVNAKRSQLIDVGNLHGKWVSQVPPEAGTPADTRSMYWEYLSATISAPMMYDLYFWISSTAQDVVATIYLNTQTSPIGGSAHRTVIDSHTSNAYQSGAIVGVVPGLIGTQRLSLSYAGITGSGDTGVANASITMMALMK